MVATSLLSNAWGVDDSTSKTPSVRRKWRSGATRIERTPMRRQRCPIHARIRLGVMAEQHFAGAHAFGGESAIGLQANADIGSGASGARPANNFVAPAQRDGSAGGAG